MIQRFAFLCLISALLLTGCATKNDAGIVLHKKPDLTKVTPGTPVTKVASLKKPTKREVITKGELKGAEAWLYEWDAPDDEVNNKMFTSVVVKDGVVLGYVEDTTDKWRKDPALHKAAKTASAFEDISGYMAQAAAYGAAASYMANHGASMVNRAANAPMQAYNNAYANSYKPWETAPSTVNYGMFGGGNVSPQPAPFSQPINTSTRAANVFDSRGALAGSVNQRGQILDSRGEVAGKINERGQIVDTRGNLSGSINDRNQILDSRGRLSGSVKPTPGTAY
jgi:major membrane immunogen (membrane-anchored lipoprotein)